jgi:hypothetical protein
MTTDNFCFYLQNRLNQTGQTGGKRYIDTSPYSIPWFSLLLLVLTRLEKTSLVVGSVSEEAKVF